LYLFAAITPGGFHIRAWGIKITTLRFVGREENPEIQKRAVVAEDMSRG
jgi:hypothetical protein